MYLYDGHMGTLYTTEDVLDTKDTYCESCNDCDELLGEFNTLSEFWKLLKPCCDIDGCGGYSLNYVFPLIERTFDIDFNLHYDSNADMVRGFCCDTVERLMSLIEMFE